MTNIEGIEIYPLISLTIFTVFFVGLVIWTLRVDKKKIDEIGDYPLNH